METNAPPAGTKRKRRPASACEPCRRKKIRCDRNCPCEHCARTKTEYCNYLLGDEANGDGTTNGRSVNTTKALGINGTITSITGLHPSVDQTSFTDYTAHGRMPSLQRPDVKIAAPRGTGKAAAVNLPLPISSSDGQQQKVIARSASHERDEDSRANSPEKRTSEEDWTVRGVFSKNRFYGQSHWMNSVHQFPEVYKVIHKLEAEETGESRAVYETCKTLTKTMKAIQPLLRASLRDYIPPRKIAEQLIQAYLRTFESAFRILHVPTFLLECENYWTNSELASEEFLIRLMLVMAIGIGFCPDCTGWTASSWIHAAQAWLGSPSAKNRVKVSGVQIHCLLLLARQSNNIGADFIWISAGALLRTAMQIGLHIDPSRLPGMSFYDQEIRRRLWATVLEITIQTTMDSGGVPLISIQDIDCEPPSNIEDEQFDQNTQTPPSSKPLDQFTQTSVQIALMRSFPVRLKIARVVNNFRSECPFDQALQLSAQLSAYCQANFLRFQPQVCSFAVRLLELLMLRFLLALHHPFAMKARKDPTLYFSRKVSLEVSLSLLARFCMGGNAPSAEKDYARLALIGAGIFRSVPVQAASTICEDLICQLEEEFSSFTPISNSFARCNLRKTIDEYTNVLRTRMSINENTIRGYLKFTSLLAHIDALQAGTSVEDSITIALRKGLLQCQQILQTRADESWVCRPDPIPPPNGQLEDLNDIHDWLATGEMVNDGSPFPMFFS